MISAAQATQYLDQALGVGMPAFLVSAAVEKVESAEAAMIDAGYSDADQTMIQCMAVAIIAAAGAPRQIASQGAASGASRSFKYAENSLTALRRSLAALDTAGTVADLVGPDPSAQAMLMVVC